MLQRLLLFAFALLGTFASTAQSNCGATAAQFTASPTAVDLPVNQTSTPPTFTVQPAGLPNTDFIVTQKGPLAADGLGYPIVGANGTGAVFAPDFGMTIGDTFFVYAFSYDLQQIKVLIHALYNNSVFPGLTCCAGAQFLLGVDLCNNLSAQGITDSSDVQSVEDLFAVMEAFSGNGGDLSIEGLVANIQDINTSLGQFGGCGGGLTELCFAVHLPSYKQFAVTGIPVSSIAVQGQGGAVSISTPNGTLQMEAIISPVNATAQNVTWSIQNLSGVGLLDQNGLLTAYSNGTVQVTATATDGTGISGSAVIMLSNQSNVAVSSIAVSPNPGSISVSGGSLQMNANVFPANATNTNVVWSITSGAFMATISPTGLLTANGNNDGTVVVRATATDGTGVYGEASVGLSNQGFIAVTSIDILQDTGFINTLNGTFQFGVELLPEDATNTNVNWSIIGSVSSADINNMGVATGYQVDTVLVVAEALGGFNVTDTAVLVIRNNVSISTLSSDPTLSLQAAPNPFQDELRLTFGCQNAADYTLQISDMLGRTIWTAQQNWAAGLHTHSVDTRELPAGVYWLQVRHKGGMVAQKVVKN